MPNKKQTIAPIELLSPAGDFKSGCGAIHYGANAIYLGLKEYSARANAVNFKNDELNQFTAYAHSMGKKVYIAVNTVILTQEINDLIKNIAKAEEYNVDAIIVQDLGVSKIIKQYFPKLSLHASTQMTIHNLDGVKYLEDLGFSRVILARELSFDDINYITNNTTLETEVFIHGSLCYSYSGQCLYSSFISGKSANRGLCTYPCRHSFNNSHPYSMKDLALKEDILKLKEAGVSSLKIEGRKKSPLYVCAVTDYYRRILDNRETTGCLDNIQRIFARPLTKLHFTAQKNKDVISQSVTGAIGLETGKIIAVSGNKIIFKTTYPFEKYDGLQVSSSKNDFPFGFSAQKLRVNSQNVFSVNSGEIVEVELPKESPKVTVGAKIYASSSIDIKKAYPYKTPKPWEYKHRYPIEVFVTINKDSVSAGVEINGKSFKETFPVIGTELKDFGKMQENTKNVFDKTGDTILKLSCLDYKNEGFFVPVSHLNELRRKIYTKAEEFITANKKEIQNIKFAYKNDVKITPKWLLKIDNEEYIKELGKDKLDNFYEILMDLDCDFNNLPKIIKNKTRISLPIIALNKELPKIKNKIKKLKEQGFNKFEVANLWGFETLNNENIKDITADYSFSVFNPEAIAELSKIGCSRITLSPESSQTTIKELSKIYPYTLALIVYQDTPLFISENCLGNCDSCKSKDNKVIKNHRNFILTEKPLSLISEINKLKSPPAFYRLDFALKNYTPNKIAELIDNFLKGKNVKNYTTANFNRGLL